MAELVFDFEWLSPEAARGPELRATWARLCILVADQPITRLEDVRAGSVRDAVYGPLYPVAEWVATNWWPILHEVESPERLVTREFARRHELAAAGEGFALPSLRILPEGGRVILQWEPTARPDCGLRFLERGRDHVDKDQAEAALRGFVSSVLSRLEDQGVGETLLAEEWANIQGLDSEELDFCRLAGAVGRDPFSMDNSDARKLEESASDMSPELAREFFACAEWSQLSRYAEAIREFRDAARRRDLATPSLEALRGQRFRILRGQAPWRQGYSVANQLRSRLDLDGRRICSTSDLGRALDVDAPAWDRAVSPEQPALGFLDAMVAQTGRSAPCFAVHGNSERCRLFSLCRALVDYLIFPSEAASLVTRSHSERQKRNRAFAAQFLAPDREIRRLIRSRFVTEDEIQDLAQDFGVSPYVVRHQIENHGLATTVGWPGE